MARRISGGVYGIQKPHFPADVVEFSSGDPLLSKANLCTYNMVPAINERYLCRHEARFGSYLCVHQCLLSKLLGSICVFV